MITDDYVSFGTAKLLKEKGFDVYVSSFYDNEGKFNRKEADWNWNIGRRYSDPTLQMTMKWLRKVHNLHVEVHYNTFWDYYQYIILYRGEKIESDMAYHSFEDAAEAVIKFCLKKLI